MAELSIEKKAQRYDEVVERAKTKKEKSRNLGLLEFIDENFPELNESEDEKIRKWLIQAITFVLEDGRVFHNKVINEAKDAIAWLEKQGRHQKFIDAIQIGDKVTRGKSGELVNFSQLDRVAKPADKVEPKFHEGDWCIDNEDGVIFQIVKVLDNTYTYKTNEGKEYSCTHYSLENDAHLWTIQDAKDGDVLQYVTDEEDLWVMIYWSLYEPYDGHVHYHALLVNDKFSDKGTCCICIDDLKPATKEQRDALEKAMRDAGYTFDFEKKETRKWLW